MAHLIGSLSEEHLAAWVDEPLERAAERFQRIQDPVPSVEAFHELLAAFLRTARSEATGGAINLAESKARDEAVSVLDEGYVGSDANGYYGALLDATDPGQPGVALVLSRFKELLRDRWRHAYTRWVFARYVDPADWRLRCALAGLLADRLRPWLPSGMGSWPPSRLAGLVPELVSLESESTGLVDEILSRAASKSF